MPNEVILRCIRGQLAGDEYRYAQRNVSILGRSAECNPRIPDDPKYSFISRHHCLLDINPPDIRVRDLGSLNGTYVNGKRIGQRRPSESPKESRRNTFLECNLRDGDELAVGDSVFKIVVHTPETCTVCGKEVTDGAQRLSQSDTRGIVCPKCSQLKSRSNLKAKSPRRSGSHCAGCGSRLGAEITRNRFGDCLCEKCREDPRQIFRGAATGDSPDVKISTLANYEILDKLGAGGMGVVYRAKVAHTGKEVALKMILPRVAASESAIKLFLREIAISRALKHRNVVSILDSGYSKGAFFLCQELCHGGTIWDWVQRTGPMPIDDAVAVTMQVLDGLEYAHNVTITGISSKEGSVRTGRGLVHRDVKPKNILLKDKESLECVKLGDYGLSKPFDLAGLSGQTFTGDTAGTPYFLCRQQVLNFKYAKPEVDVWATAASLYYMLTGRYPRAFGSDRDPFKVVLESQPTPIREHQAGIPQALAEAIDHALQDAPEIPLKRARDLRETLQGAL